MKNGLGPAGRLARAFIDSKLTPLIIAAAILLGLGAVLLLPREEEPQIIVPMIDVFVQMPGASAREVEERVTKPLEKLLWEVPGVEYIYSTSSPGSSMAVVRFYVGQNEEGAIVRLNQKMFANFDLIPAGASPPLVKPRSIDDVPILALTLTSDRYDHFTLRRIAAPCAAMRHNTSCSRSMRVFNGSGQRPTLKMTGGREDVLPKGSTATRLRSFSPPNNTSGYTRSAAGTPGTSHLPNTAAARSLDSFFRAVTASVGASAATVRIPMRDAARNRTSIASFSGVDATKT